MSLAPSKPKQPSLLDQLDTLLTDADLHLFNEGTHYELWRKLGSHVVQIDGQLGTHFAVWAPNAKSVAVIGEFNHWNKAHCLLRPRGNSGIWEGFLPGVDVGTIYMYHIISHANDYTVDKADPFAVRAEIPPRNGSVVWNLDYDWNDDAWMADRTHRNRLDSPISIYEVHVGS